MTNKNPDPAGLAYSGDIGSYINTQEKIKEAVEKFKLAYDRAYKAEDHASRGYVQESIETWGKIFGAYFPAWG
ncbi:hypothetical protein FJZ33_00515 [Candidatus Poribacteria bacterium]|nr:hypothetical protein [Candidatus Poribacteria bacterium]